jgi:hypothetical protein
MDLGPIQTDGAQLQNARPPSQARVPGRTDPLVRAGTCVERRQAYRDRDARCLQ